MSLWWNLCTLYFLACHVRLTAGDSGLCYCVYVTSFECGLTPLCADSNPPFVCWYILLNVLSGTTQALCSYRSYSVPDYVQLSYSHLWPSIYYIRGIACLTPLGAATRRQAISWRSVRRLTGLPGLGSRATCVFRLTQKAHTLLGNNYS